MASDPLPRTKEDLLKAGQILVVERGFTATSVDEICSAAGSTKGAFYYFFASKQAFAEELLEYIWAPVRAMQGTLADAAVDPFEVLLQHVEFMARFIVGDGRLMGILAQELSSRDPGFRERLRGYFRAWTRDLEGLVEAARSRHAPAAAFSPSGVMEFVIAVLEGIPVVSRQLGSGAADRALDHLKAYLRQLFGIGRAGG